jgi:hypothetical protein|tara:strand:+ start:414 stop:602 length:189 start_codon:yes stop_codon:yes gene_type:complete
MFVIFCISQVIAGFFLFIFGAGLIESPESYTMALGCLISVVGFLNSAMYLHLLDEKLKGKEF